MLALGPCQSNGEQGSLSGKWKLKGWRFAFARFSMNCVGPKPLGTAVKKNAEQRSILTLSTDVRDPRTVLRNNYRRDLKCVKLRNFEEETEIKDRRSMMDSCPPGVQHLWWQSRREPRLVLAK
jgi:hypothetical protein